MNDEWETQDDLYLKLDDEFSFDFDLCANANNTKCPSFSTDVKEFAVCTDVDLYDNYWMNPPYSRKKIKECMTAVDMINGHGKMVVTLTRFDPTADWFKSCVDGVAAEVRMLEKRLKFKGADSSYPFPCCVSIYYGERVKETDYYLWGWK
jgi:phage N-6-adenine-methyltransferase